MIKLLIGNKNYSSWSMRAWLVLAHFDIKFSEEILPLDGDSWRDVYAQRTPSGTVPVLEHEGVAIGETLAIIEYLAEEFPDKAIWPADKKLRALARAAASEMHAGFLNLRTEAPQNIRATLPEHVPLAKVQADLERIEVLLKSLLDVSGGPFLCGQFCAVDAMFAPVAFRIKTYGLPVSQTLSTWFAALESNEAVQSWVAASMMEEQVVRRSEISLDKPE